MLNTDCVYWWRLILKEDGPKIVHVKSIHNTFINAISRLDSGPIPDDKDKANWMTLAKIWCHYTMDSTSAENTHDHSEQIKMVFANRSEEDVFYPLTVKEIAQAQKHDAILKKLHKHDKYSNQLAEDT